MAESYAVLGRTLAAKVREMVQWWERQGLGGLEDTRTPTGKGIYFKNNSGATIPAYGCIQASGTHENVLNYLTVERAFDYSAVQSVVLFNGPFEVPDGEFGTAQCGPVFIATHDAAIAYNVGDRMGWKSSSFNLALGAPLVYLGADDVVTNGCRVAWDHSCMSGQSISAIAAGASGTVYRRKASSGSFTTDTTRSYTAYNDSGTEVAADSRILMFPVDGRWVIVEVC
jgi:hypothetical protein